MDIAEQLLIPKDAVLGFPIITIIGNQKLYIENFKSIMEYSCNELNVLTKKGCVKITGSNLIIDYYNDNEISIKGHFQTVSL